MEDPLSEGQMAFSIISLQPVEYDTLTDVVTVFTWSHEKTFTLFLVEMLKS